MAASIQNIEDNAPQYGVSPPICVKKPNLYEEFLTAKVSFFLILIINTFMHIFSY